MSDDLVAFLRARLDEDEQAANAVGFGRIETGEYLWGTKYLLLQDGKDGQSKATTEVDSDLAEHITRHDPARVLAEVAAKRKTLDDCEGIIVGWHYEESKEFARDVLRNVALPYADHPDYRQEWRP